MLDKQQRDALLDGRIVGAHFTFCLVMAIRRNSILLFLRTRILQSDPVAQLVDDAGGDGGNGDTAWSVVELSPFKALKKPVTLAQIKADKQLADMQIIKLSRLSVSSVKPHEFNHILALSETK